LAYSVGRFTVFGLFDDQFPVLAQGRLAALARVRAVLEHEHLAARWGNLAQEAGSGFGKHRHMVNEPKLLINLLHLASV